MTKDNTNERENRDGNDSSLNNDSGSGIRKKRTRVGDLRKQSYDVSPSDRDRNPYRSGSDSNYGSERPSYDQPRGDGERRSYGGDQGGRPSYGNQDRSSDYNRRGGYSDNQNRDNNRGGGYGGNNRDNNRGSGYSDNRSSGGYGGNNRDNNRGGGYSDNRSSGGYGGGGNNRDNNRGGGYGGGNNRDNSRGGGGSYGGNRDNNRGGGGYGGNNDRRGGGGGYDRGQGGGSRMSQGPKRIVKPVKYKENIDPNTPIRLNKYLANAGVCSRREADSFITSGLVKVNGEVVNELGSKVLRGDMVTFNDQPIRLESKVYVLLNKPKNCVTTSDDPQNRTTVMDLVRGACPERIYPVGRLDRNTTGVLLLTNDGDLASKLMHPKYSKKKIYQVTLDRDVAIEDMQAIADGIELDDGEIHADSIAYHAEDVLNVVGIEIHSGRNRIVRRIFEKLNYQVVKLDRVYFAGLTKKNVLRGKWRYLSEKEVNMLRMGAFE